MKTTGDAEGLLEYPLPNRSSVDSISDSNSDGLNAILAFKPSEFELGSKKCTSNTLESEKEKKVIKRAKKPNIRDKTSEIFNCKICSKVFHSKHGVKFHEKYTHTKPKFDCLVCKKSFKLTNDLDRHMKTHTGNRPFQCRECEKTFVCKSSLMQHVRLKHIIGDAFKCKVCDKGFNKESDLERHSTVHSGAKAFNCSMCTKKFSCKSSLKVHERSHEGKKYVCSFCDKHFYEKCDLTRHETIHTGIKPWKCKVCDKGYSCKSTLGVHLKNTHTKNPTQDMYVYTKKTDKKKAAKKRSLLISEIEDSDLETFESETKTVRVGKEVHEEPTSDIYENSDPDNQHFTATEDSEPHISIEMVNDEAENVTEMSPITLYQQSLPKSRRKPKFIRKIEISDNCIMMCEK